MDPVVETMSEASGARSTLAMAAPKTSPMDVVTYEILSCTKRERLAAAAAADDAAGDQGGDGPDPDVFDVVLCLEKPVNRGYAILTWLHEPSAVDMSYARNGLSLLMEHGARTGDQLFNNIIDPWLHVGVLEDIRVENKKLLATMRFSRHDDAQKVKRDVQDRTRRFLSAGLIKLKWKLTKAAGSPDELDEYLVTRWMPVEGSIVSVPALPGARVLNSAAGQQQYPVELERDTPEPEVTQMNNQNAAPAGTAAPTGGAAAGQATVDRENLNAAGGQAAIDAAVNARQKQMAQIVELCNSQGCSARAGEFIEKGFTPEQAAMEILKGKVTDGSVRGVSAEIRDAMPLKDRKRWSLRRAMDLLCRRAEGRGDFDGVEAEVSGFIEKRAQQAGIQGHNGIWMPTSVVDETERFTMASRPIERHTMVSNVATKGLELVFDQPAQLIEILRNATVCMRMGAQVLGDLVGQIPFPKQTGDVTVSFVGENPSSAVAASDVTTGLVTLVGKTMQGKCVLSRQLIRTASYDVDLMVQNSFAAGHGLAFDRQGLHGTGALGQCTGIYSAPDVAAIACGSLAPTWQRVLDHLSAVATANAHDGKLGFVTTYALGARLKNQLKSSVGTTGFVWEGRLDNGSIDGYLAMASNQASSVLGAGANEHAFIFGNWAEMIFGLWGGLELVNDPYTAADQGLVKFTSFQMGDLILRHGQSFAKATAANLT